MDQDTVQQALEVVSSAFDWTPFMWIAGIIGTIISGLLAAIVMLLQSSKHESSNAIKDFREAWNKHDDLLREQQREIAETRQDTKVAIELIKVEQQQGWERLKTFEKHFFDADKKRGKR